MKNNKLLIIVMICILAAVNACGGETENTSEITNDEFVTSTQNESTDSTIRTQDDVSTSSENTSEITNDESATSTQNESTDSTIRTQDDVSTGSEAYSFTEDKDIEFELPFAEHVYPEGTEYIPYSLWNNRKKSLTVRGDQLFLLKEKDGEWELAGSMKDDHVTFSVTITAESFEPGTIKSSELDKGKYRICLNKDGHIYYQDFEIERIIHEE